MKKTKPTHLLAFASLAFIVSASSASAAVAYYSFDSDFTDGVGSNDLTNPTGAPVITTTGAEVKFGDGALSMDGSSFLDFSSTITFGTIDEWSVSFWGKRFNDNRTGGVAAAASGMVLGTTSGFIWTPDNSTVVQGMRLRINGDNDFGGTAESGNAIPDDGEYHHWVVIANSSGFTVYRDNVLLGTQASGTNVSFDQVGTGAGSNNIYEGAIDELYIFDEAIDSGTVNSLFSANAIPEPSSMTLVGLAGFAMLGRRRRA